MEPLATPDRSQISATSRRNAAVTFPLWQTGFPSTIRKTNAYLGRNSHQAPATIKIKNVICGNPLMLHHLPIC